MKELRDDIWRWIAWRMPRRLVYWAFVRVWATATTGPYLSENPSSTTCVQASERWDKK